MAINKKYFFVSIAIALALCAAQIRGSTLLILMCLAVFLALTGIACIHDFTLPILLFFLPWSPLLRTSPNTFSFFTFGTVLVCVISVIKRRFWLKRYHIETGILLALLTLASKLIDGSTLSFAYIAFLMMIVLFPTVKEEWLAHQYDFFQVVFFLSAGVIAAALCAQQFAASANIAKYIRVDSYLTITRMCGFYGDPNFYTAQITAALSGCLITILEEKKKAHLVVLGILIFLLIYCGFLSGSKSFALVCALIVFLWFAEVLRMRKKTGRKMVLVLGTLLIVTLIATSQVFSSLIDVIATRFSYAHDLKGFTTGRTDRWKDYLEVLFGSPKTFFLGKGLTNIKINGLASHNTILQIFFQFGIVGVPILIKWIACFFQDAPRVQSEKKRKGIYFLILVCGTFVPWLAIDALLFDEFFLFQWYAFMCLQQLNGSIIHESSPNEKPTNRKTSNKMIPSQYVI